GDDGGDRGGGGEGLHDDCSCEVVVVSCSVGVSDKRKATLLSKVWQLVRCAASALVQVKGCKSLQWKLF
ncbi:hypothetical protein, partial [Streptomyces sp. NPDC004435]|uniref:hypothetical protein n=1 Tax=Streptomyces sp. NPDC004435 TaxID=3364701 RepID=UPI0036CA4BE5